MAQEIKLAQEINEFNNNFSAYRDKKIVLYGTGRMTATLLANDLGFNIVGLCDRDDSLIGSTIYGKKILDQKTVEQEADMLIINTWDTYWNTIYQRIQNWNIPIYYRNGKRAKLVRQKTEQNNPYWEQSLSKLKDKTKEYDVVSFDIFDTLVMRKVFFQIDVFRIIEKVVSDELGENVDFVNLRKSAAAMLDNPTLEAIYNQIKSITGWEQKKIDYIKKYEEETEMAIVSARTELVDLCNALAETKEVYFVSDMYYESDFLLKILKKVGVKVNSKQILVSCECGKSKEDGTLWRWYKEKYVRNKKALHIGDNIQSDYTLAKENGIDAYRILSAHEMVQNSSLCDVMPNIIHIYDSIVMGCLTEKLFNSPFALNETKGTLCFSENKQVGYALLGSVVYSFHVWLLQNIMKYKNKQILFFARDGYLMIEEFNYLCKLLKIKNRIKVDYLEISRPLIWNVNIFSTDDIYHVAEFPYNGKLSDFLKERYGLNVNVDESVEDVSELQKNKDKMKWALKSYEEKILRQAEEVRKYYNRYIESVVNEKNLAVVDLWIQGTTQYFFSKYLGQHTMGYYFYACVEEDNEYAKTNEMRACFQKENDKGGKDGELIRHANFVESFFTAPRGMTLCLDERGKFQYAANMTNQKRFDIRLAMQDGILEFMEEIIDLQQHIGIKELMNRPRFADELFGCLMKGGFEPSDEMKKSFYYDNAAMNDREFPIWE